MTLLDVVLVINIILKLTGNIHWSWWLVLWPLWVSIPLIVWWHVEKSKANRRRREAYKRKWEEYYQHTDDGTPNAESEADEDG